MATAAAAGPRAAASVLRREAMRQLDASTIASGTPSLELMERAGRELADFVSDSGRSGIRLPGAAGRLLVLAGRGNNGGDGFVVARLLASRRWKSVVALISGEPAAGSDAAANLAEWRRIGGSVTGREEALEILRGGGGDFDLALDAIFGTGLTKPVTGPEADLIRCLNESGLPVVAADIPSGLCSDAGVPLGIAVRCRATLAIGAAKPGLLLAQGPDYAGRVRIADIGLRDPAEAGIPVAALVLDESTTAGAWPALAPLAHKGSRGHVLVVAGSRGKTGAAVLAARAALRAGAGLVTVASVAEVQAAVSVALPEAMTWRLDADEHGEIARSSVDALRKLVDASASIVAGPGLGVGAGPEAVVELLLASERPLVLDADALNVISAWEPSRSEAAFAGRAAAGAPPPILTPHPGEMSRLCGLSTVDIQLQRDVCAASLAELLGAVVVLKGAATIVTDGKLTAYNLSGNPGMAAAGMGDVLSGVCGALLARLPDPRQAASLAVYVHGAAGDAAGAPGFLASEVADRLPAVLASRCPR